MHWFSSEHQPLSGMKPMLPQGSGSVCFSVCIRALLGLYNFRGVGGPARLCRDQVGQPPGAHWFESCLSSPPWRLWGGSGVISAESTITHGAPALPLLVYPGLGLAEHHRGSGTVLGTGEGWKTQELPSGHSCVMETSMGRRSPIPTRLF